MSTDTITSDITFADRERMIGKRIRAISGNSRVSNGSEYTVTGVWHFREHGEKKIDGITVNVSEGGLDHESWVQSYEVIEDEEITFDTRERMIGKTIRVLYAGSYPNLTGQTHVVTSTFGLREPARDRDWVKVDGITVGITAEGLNNLWVQSYEVVDDTTVIGEFKVGDCVRYTGILTNDGIEDTSGQGVIVEASGDVYVIQTGRNASVVSGPGYMFPTVIVEHGWRLGQKFKVLDYGTASGETEGQVGILTGFGGLAGPLLTFPRNIQQYLTNFPGSWSFAWGEIELIEDTEAPAEEPVGPKEWEVGDFVYTNRGSIHPVLAGVIVSLNEQTVYMRSTPDFADRVGKDNIKECPVVGVGSKVVAHCVTPTQFREEGGVLVEITGMDYAGNFTGTTVSGGDEVQFSEWGPALDETGAPLDEDTAMFTDGDAVVVINRDDEWNGREGTYRGPESGGSTRHRIEFPGHGPAYFNLGEIARRTVEPVVEVAPEPVVDDSEVARLQRRLTAAEAEVASGKEAVSIIGGRLIEEANNRGWCSDYDRIIENVNSEVASGWELPKRNNEFTVTWTETFTVTVNRSGTYTASDEDAAMEIAKEEETADSYQLRDAIDNGNYSFEEADDYEASQE